MSNEELENYETESQMALYNEYKEVSDLFSYIVETDRRFYLANKVEVTPKTAGDSLYFDVTLNDVWVWDIFRKSRFVKSVHVYSLNDVNVEEKSEREDLTIPDMPDFPPPS